jgi:hypothetical protein
MGSILRLILRRSGHTSRGISRSDFLDAGVTGISCFLLRRRRPSEVGLMWNAIPLMMMVLAQPCRGTLNSRVLLAELDVKPFLSTPFHLAGMLCSGRKAGMHACSILARPRSKWQLTLELHTSSQ